jgi:hypothetical protein
MLFYHVENIYKEYGEYYFKLFSKLCSHILPFPSTYSVPIQQSDFICNT